LALFLVDLLAAFWGVAEAEPVAGAAATGAAAGAALLVVLLAPDFLVPFLEILLEPPAFLVDLLATFFPAGLALAIRGVNHLCLKNELSVRMPLKNNKRLKAYH
jgi:hypothetical protein